MRIRTIIPLYCICDELNLTEGKRYDILEVTNENQRYINDYVFTIKNDNGDLVKIDNYSIEEVPRVIKRLFADKEVKTINFNS